MADRATRLRAIRYALRRRLADWRYGQHKARGELRPIGAVLSVHTHERGVTLITEQGALRLLMIAPDCIQVRFLPGIRPDISGKVNVPPAFSYAVARVTWPPVEFNVRESDDAYTLVGPALSCRVARADSRLTFLDAAGHIVAQDAAPIAVRDGELRLSRFLPDDEGCFGLATQSGGFDLRGQRYIFWNSDQSGSPKKQVAPSAMVPFYLGLSANTAPGTHGVQAIFWDNPSRGWVDVGAEDASRMTFSASLGELRYYQFAAPTIAGVLMRYTELTGHTPLPPIWALGFHLSRQSYTSAERLREIAHELRRRHIPCDVLYLDFGYTDGHRAFTWNPRTFPAPAVLLSDLADQGFSMVAVLGPAIKVDETYRVYQSGAREGIFVTLPNNKTLIGPSSHGDSVYPDFTSPKARAWWAAQFEPLFAPGVSGIANDANEPTLSGFGKKDMPDSARHNYEGEDENKGVNHVMARNVYGMLMARASREASEKKHADKRPFNLTRAAYAGAQRYAAIGVGSAYSDWEHLRASIRVALNSGLAGLAFVGSDVGGFLGRPDAELFARWMQVGAMMPFFRVRTAAHTPDQELWSFGDEIEAIGRRYINLRYELLPYFYSTFAQCAQYGLPVVRPLFMFDPADPALRGVDDSFMVGESVLAAPILARGQTEREVYLPRGRWYNYHTGQALSGGQRLIIKAPLHTLPLFVRAGHVLPLWALQQYVGEKSIDELRMKIYRGDGEITLYEDAGEGLAYQSGDYRWLYFTCKPTADGGLSATWRRAGKYQPTYEKVRCEVYGIEREPQEVRLDNAIAPLWYYEKGVVEFTANKPFETARIILPEKQADATLMRSPFRDHD
jgi:alpha-glucosidase